MRDNIDEPGGIYAKRNKPVTEGHILHDISYMRYLKSSNSWKQRTELRVLRDGGGSRVLLISMYKFQLHEMNEF